MTMDTGNSISVNVKLRQRSIPVGGVSLSWTVLRFKRHLEAQIEDNCPVTRQRLIFKGRILSSEDRTLSDYGIMANDSIYLVIGGGSNSNASSSPGSGGTTASTSPSVAATSSPGPANSISNNGLNNPASMMGMFGGSGNNDMMNAMQQQLMQDPEMVRNMMNSPIFDSMMNNPDLLRGMMESNPQFQALAEQNPEIRHLLDNPEMMRQSMEMMRNPQAMQQFMRHQDLALSQIENVPGGFAALSRMYRDVQEPMMNAMIPENTSTSNSSASNSANANQGAAGTAMPNPWGSSNTTTRNNTSNTNNNTSGTGGGSNTNMFNPWAANTAGGGGTAAPPNFGSGMGNPFAGGTTGNQQQQLEQTINMLENNPMMRQMMDQMMTQNPEMITQMMQSNPMIQEMARQNPAMASVMSDPQFIRSMMQPETMRAMLNLQRTMGGSLPGAVPANNPASGAGTGNNNNIDFSNLLNQFQSTNLFQSHIPAAANNNVPPEQRYQMQLQSLNDMGFDDNVSNIRVLEQTHGNVNRAIDILLSSPPSAPASSPSAAAIPPAAANPSVPEETQETPKDQNDKKND